MADVLSTNPMQVDITSGTKRVLFTGQGKILSIVLDGDATAGGVIVLKQDSTAGTEVWRYTPVAAAQQHVCDDVPVRFTNSLYIAAAADADFTAWTSGVLSIYLA